MYLYSAMYVWVSFKLFYLEKKKNEAIVFLEICENPSEIEQHFSNRPPQ